MLVCKVLYQFFECDGQVLIDTFVYYIFKVGVLFKMKTDIHPNYNQATVKCSCGNEFTTGSTVDEIKVEVCSKCHPFYTGSQKLLLEAGGRVEKFKKKYSR